MDKRKLDHFKKQAQDFSEDTNMREILNSTQINQALIDNAETMLGLEFILKQKA